ncbi:hypothetical protein SAMD00019534_030880 [Acytostelium subglobosum LB1]|uniref:hypothetical protein n=1 Tax=Acytostelium subglobosum LB1 TaxID=1410327 RepID=UPI000644E19D|nr:hypothetical protein SAMD00019534_030880 [Acytostelium subglobosum LB1]GAM19913.1 hypothetical protein SAMD00019534_030880 [Acytostelium subglobosum LB1]|eukprot:XP_012756675.1 hypothetical protein SAMD00019534_030880 [Acytostelium subglobosum LB1]
MQSFTKRKIRASANVFVGDDIQFDTQQDVVFDNNSSNDGSISSGSGSGNNSPQVSSMRSDDAVYNLHSTQVQQQQQSPLHTSSSGSASSSATTTSRYKIQSSFDIPYPVKNAIDQLDPSYFNDSDFKISGNITLDGVVYVILPTEMYIWSLETPQQYDRVDIPNQLNEHQVVVTRNSKNYGTYSAFIATTDGGVRYWPQTNKPSHSQDIALDFRKANVFLAECNPFGVVIGNSLGSVYLLSLKRGALVVKLISKSQGLLSYLYLAKQSPVVAVFSTAQLTSAQRNVYVLTENSLLKYEINENGERLIMDQPLQRDIQQALGQSSAGAYKTCQLFVDSQGDDANETDTAFILLCQSTPESKLYYLMSLQVANNQALNPKAIERFSCQCFEGNQDFRARPMLAVTSSNKYYLSWMDRIYFFLDNKQDNNGEIKLTDLMLCSGVWNSSYYFIDRQTGVQILNIAPFQTKQQSGDNQGQSSILFDIPEEEDQIGAMRNILLRTLNSYSTKKQHSFRQSLELVRKMDPKHLDAALCRTSSYIADCKPNAKYWATGSETLHQLGTSMSVQLKQQIEDKLKRHALLDDMLQENDLLDDLSKETRDLMDHNVRRLKAASDLRDFQNTQQESEAPTNSVLTHLIQETVSDRLGPNWASNGMNVYELFYSNVAMLDQLLVRFVKTVRMLDATVTDSLLKLRTILEANSVIIKIIKNYSTDMLFASINNTNDSIHRLLKQLIESINSFIETDLKTGPAHFLLAKAEVSLTNSENLLYEQLLELTNIYLQSLKDNEEQSFGEYSTLLIAPFIQSHRYQMALQLAQKYGNYSSIIQVYLSDKENREQQLSMLHTSLRRFRKEGIIDKVYAFMLDYGMRQELLQLPEEFSDSLSRFLEHHPQIAWINSLRLRQWNSAAKVLLEESQREAQSVSNKNTMLNLAKISMMAENKKPLPNRDQLISCSNQALELIKIQREFLPNEKQPLGISNLIGEILTHTDYQPLDRYSICFNALEESKLLTTTEERIHLFKSILFAAFDHGGVMDLCRNLDASTSDKQFDMMIIESDYFQLLHCLPRDEETSDVVQSFISDFNKLKQKSMTDERHKHQLSRILSRVIELCRQY